MKAAKKKSSHLRLVRIDEAHALEDECTEMLLEARVARMTDEERAAFDAKCVRRAALTVALRVHAEAVRKLKEAEHVLADALELVIESIDEVEAANDLLLGGARAEAEAA